MHKVFGVKENETYFDRKGAYIIPIKENKVAVVQTPKGYFLIGGGLENGENDKVGIERECMEETGYSVLVKDKVCSAETFYFEPSIGFFHPIQVYYSGDLLDMVQRPKEKDHKLVWVEYDAIIGNMYHEMQSWAIEQIWNSI